MGCGLRPAGAIGAYPPACKPNAYKPTGWKQPRREVKKAGSRKWEGGSEEGGKVLATSSAESKSELMNVETVTMVDEKADLRS